MLRVGLLFLLLSTMSLTVRAQHIDSTETPVDAFVDDVDTATGTGEAIAERLIELQARPVDVNAATASELAAIPGLSLLLARRIVRHRSRHGRFSSPSDLLTVEGIDPQQYRRLRPFITTSPVVPKRPDAPTRPEPWSAAVRDAEIRTAYRWTRRLDLGRGYRPDSARTGYQGGPARHTSRTEITLGERLLAAAALDKDPGEAWRWDMTDRAPGFDHVAGTLAITDLGPISSIIIGDYTVSAGHGVGLWRGPAFGKGRNAVDGILRDGRGIAPFASTEENRFFRGLALQIGTERWLQDRTWMPVASVSSFISRRRLDASIDDRTDPLDPPWTNLSSTGLHRTTTERANRDAVTESVAGTLIKLEGKRWSVGGAALASTVDRRRVPRNRPSDAFDHAGRHLRIASLHAIVDAGPSILSGEIARGPGGSLAAVGGFAYQGANRVDLALHARHYAPEYDNRFGFGFSETAPQNETGLYVATRVRIHDHWNVIGYVDHYRFPWLRYNMPRPTTGRDVRLIVEHAPRPWLKHYVQLRTETKDQRIDGHTGPSPLATDGVAPETRSSVRWDVDYAWSDRLRLGTRLESVVAHPPGGSDTDSNKAHGTLLVQDVEWDVFERVRLIGRIAIFETDGYEARLFAYERGPRYAFRVPALFGRGERSYVVLRAELTEHLLLEAKYAVTRYDDRVRIGSGRDEHVGNRVREVDLQLHLRFP